MRLRRRLAAALVVVAAAGCGGDDDDGGQADTTTTAAPVQAASDAQGLARVPELYSALEASVVTVRVRGTRGAGEGSGVVIRPDKIVTNNHVVAGADRVTVVLASGERLAADLLAADERTDLAILDVERDDLPPAPLATELPEVGSLAVAIGNPLGFESSVTAGIVSGLERAIPSGGQTPALVGLVQTDAPISPGNSGGALVGADGRVVGVNIAYIPPQARAESIGFAIPAPTVRQVVEELLADGEVAHPYLGVQLRPITATAADQLGLDVEGAAAVVSVERQSPADRAGLEPGDVIVRVDDRRVTSVEDVLTALRGREPGDSLRVEVLRGGERREVTAELTERPGG